METVFNYFRFVGLCESLSAAKSQTACDTVTDPVETLQSLSKEVFAREVKARSLQSGQKAYMFALRDQVMFVLLDDHCPGADELADEEEFEGEEPLYFTSDSHRVSPLYVLQQLAEKVLWEYSLHDVRIDRKHMCLFLLTSSCIVNEEDMKAPGGGWCLENVFVCDNYRFVSELELEPSDEDGERAQQLSLHFDEVEEKMERVPDSDFERLLEEFVASSQSEEKEEEEQQCFGFDDDDFDFGLDDDLDLDEALKAQEEALEEKKRSLVFEPVKGDWEEYVDANDTDFYDFMAGESRRLPVAPHTIYEPICNAATLLDNMVGIAEMKGHIMRLIDLEKYNKLLYLRNGTTHEVTLHSVFTGNPGTGKTTLASILGSLLKEAGVLSRGHVVMCNRASFCSGTRWGDEEKAVLQLVKIARGGVLFIDEAYNLLSANPHDPGYQVLPNLLTMLSDESMRDICVVLAGYPKEMKGLLDTNPGIDSRFPNKFEFRDYTLDELMKITATRLKRYGYSFTPAARHAFLERLTCLYNARDKKKWGNARTVANLLDQTYIQHAIRVVNSKDANILKLKVRDIPAVTPASAAKPRIGFCAR